MPGAADEEVLQVGQEGGEGQGLSKRGEGGGWHLQHNISVLKVQYLKCYNCLV